MEVKNMRRKVSMSFVVLIFSICLFVVTTYAYFLDQFTDTFNAEMGEVDVDLYAYFDDGGSGYSAQEVVINSSNSGTATDIAFSSTTKTITSTIVDLSVFSDGDTIRIQGSTNNDGQYTVNGTPTSGSLIVLEDLTDESAGASITIDEVITKPGIYFINVVSNGNDYFFEDFRIYIDINSSVDTYIRVKVYEQLTLTYEDYQGNFTELTVLFDGYMPFTYDTGWYDNRTYDSYIYYQTALQRVNESTPYVLDLISSYTGENFNTYSPGYSLQIAFSIEAVQSDGGPENVWELSTPPWGGSW